MIRKATAFFITLLLLLPAIGGLATAERSMLTDDDFMRRELRVSEFSQSTQSRVSLAETPEGGLLLAWDSRRQQGGTYGVYGRRVDEIGKRLGSEYALNLSVESHQMHPAIAVDERGSWVVWESWGQDGDAQAGIGRSAGGSEVVLGETWRGSQSRPVAAILAGGERLAVWTTPGETPANTMIMARRFAASGEALGSEFAISATGAAQDRLPAVAASDDGFVVAWTRDGTSCCGQPFNEIRCRRFSSSGVALGDETRVGAGFEPNVAMAMGGEFVIAWMANDGTNTRALASRFDADGESLDAQPIAASDGMPGWQSGAAVAMDEQGNFAIAWNQLSTNGEDCDIYARLYDAAGNPRSSNLRVNETTAGWQSLQEATGTTRIALDDSGRLAVAWSGDSDQGDASAANLTLLMPEPKGLFGKLALRWRLAFASRGERHGKTRPTEPLEVGALPHTPPVFNADDIGVGVETEPYFPGSESRDEGWQAFGNTGWNPPDPHMAIGPDHVMATVNGGLAAYDRVGNELWFADIGGTGGFWFDIAGSGGFVFDPEVIYDPHEGRFMAMANARNNGSYFYLAISATSDATGAWHKYAFNVTSEANGSDIDSPNFAVDENAIYLTADFFGPDKYLIHIVDKSSVIDGGTAVSTYYLNTGSQSIGIPVMYDAAPTQYMVEGLEGTHEDQLILHAINDPLGSPSLTSFALDVPDYWDPTSSHSQGTSSTVFLFEARFWSCVYRNGSLWACHHIAPTASRNSSAARWYEIEMNGWPTSGDNPSLKQSGTVLPGGTGWATFNSITVNEFGAAAMCFAYSSPNDYFKMMRVARSASDPLGQMGDPVLVKESSGVYSGSRWGDYSAAVVDPVDNRRFWMIHEYAISGSWRTWVSNFLPDLTALPPVASGNLPAQIRGAYPNPSEGPTRLSFSLEQAGNVAIEIYDVQGRRVRRIAGGGFSAGNHELAWDGRNELGELVANGQYLSRLEFDGRQTATQGQRVTVIR